MFLMRLFMYNYNIKESWKIKYWIYMVYVVKT